VGSIGSPVALCHWKPSFTASKGLARITASPYPYDGLPSPSSVATTDSEVRGTTMQPEAKLPQLALSDTFVMHKDLRMQ